MLATSASRVGDQGTVLFSAAADEASACLPNSGPSCAWLPWADTPYCA